MTVRDDATARQQHAADPAASAWVSANAGSGKTRVLTDRVARLLLGGVPPERILCLTYTKAAAAEMQNRLFRRLGAWAMLEDRALRRQLAELGAAPTGPLGPARRLFARAIEAPGGLKIQTIHAFSAGLLRRFPLEAGVSPDFAELDDRAQRLLLDEVLDALAAGPEAPSVAAVARGLTGDLAELAAEIVGARTAFAAPPPASWLAVFGAPADLTAARLVAETFPGGEAALVAALVAALRAGSTRDLEAAEKLAAIDLAAPGLAEIAALEGIFLYGAAARKNEPFTAKIGEFPTRATQTGAAAPLMSAVEALMRRVEAARPRRCALEAAAQTAALHDFARVLLAAYGRRKAERGLLDFDDLILGAGALLARPGVAEWVLYRLDGGIDHILVDEAQDTSPAQWQVVQRIAEEFFAGESARSDLRRTLFVVGDVKQSIYSFQGADPAGFERMAGHFGARIAAAGAGLVRADLLHSFRSAPEILGVVDAAFARPERHAGLGGAPVHKAFHDDHPGRVDLWPVVPVARGEDDGPWYDPVDRAEPAHHDLVLARKVAAEIARLCDPACAETLALPARDGLPRRRRRFRPGDFLVLVQRRSPLFAELIRACKAAGLPIAGADRLRLGAELAVRDLAALLRFLALPEDSLSLAEALRSPLFGWSEDRLFRLAHGRGTRFLWEALRRQGAADGETVAMLDDLRRAADFLRPFELIERVLIRHGGRRRLLARLGPEAEDGIDALLAQAMAYERSAVPSLMGFLTWMETDDVEVKRQLPSEGGVVRVMTVHGAKGLEAPVVILPDTRAAPNRDRGQIIADADGRALWRTAAADAPAAVAAAVAARRARAAEERMRLLYVAMTRAESWLIVAGSGEMTEGSWHGIVAEAMVAKAAVAHDFPTGSGLRWEHEGWSAGPVEEARAAGVVATAPPAWAESAAPPPVVPPPALSPSDLGGAKALPGEAGLDEAAAKRRGRLLHRLLEHLPTHPAAVRPMLVGTLLAAGADTAAGAEAEALGAEALRLLGDPAFAWLFGEASLAEVPLVAALPELGGRTVTGAIDRLILATDHVHAVDFKTNALVPATAEAVPEGVLRQMAAYAAALDRIYPGGEVRVSILWTAGPRLMALPRPLLAAALGRVSAP